VPFRFYKIAQFERNIPILVIRFRSSCEQNVSNFWREIFLKKYFLIANRGR
jgi:hypothetical protein